MGSKTQTANTNQTTTPVNTAALQQIYGQVANAAATPYTPYNGQLVAPVNAQQIAGINNINAAANQAQPYYAQAGQLASGAANPLTAAQIQQYQNPYTQSVVNATQAQLNDLNGQQQNQLKGNAAAEGALGGDRQAVAQSTLAGQQALNEAPTIANLYANSYNSGLSTAENQFQQNPLAAASSIANIGAGAQNAALTGAGQQINAGTLQQQTQQAQDTANYGQYQAAQGFPFQEAAYLEQYGLPAALAQGSTTSGAQTAQGPSNIAPYLGAGIAGAGLFLKDGGQVNGYAPGGYISAPDYITAGQGYLPNTSPSQSTLQTPSLQFLKPNSNSSSSIPMTGAGGFGSLGSSLKNDFGSASFGGGNVFSDDAWGGDKSNPLPGLDASDYGYKVGGLVEAIHGIHKAIKRSRGGSVSSLSPFQAFDDGGDVSFADRFQPAVDSPLGSLSPAQAENLLTATNSDNAVINPDSPFRLDPSGPVQGDPSNMPAGIPSNAPSVVASDVGSSPMTAALPPQITNPDNVPDVSSSPALAYDNTPSTVGSSPTIASFVPHPDEGHAGLLGTNLSDKTRSALVAAGLGIMASRSPFLGVALGEGGLQGLKNYSESTKAEQEAADKAATRAQEQQRIDLQAKQIAQNASQFAKTNALAERREKFTEDKTPAGYREKDNGNYEAIPGGPADPAVLKAAAEAKRIANAVLDDDTVHDMASQYLAGDRTVMQNLGRGQQGAENIVKLRQEIARQARDQGIDPKGIVNAFNEQAGALAGQRAVGTRAANISLAANEANNMIPIALAASDKLPRTQFMPWNQMVQAVQKGSSSPELASFVAATNSLVNAYVRAVSPSGVPTDAMRQHAYDMLNAAQGPEAYKAVVATMQKEMQAALQAPGQVKAELRKGNDPTAAAMPTGAPTAPPTNKPTTVIQNGHTYTLQPDGSYK